MEKKTVKLGRKAVEGIAKKLADLSNEDAFCCEKIKKILILKK